MAAQEPRWPQGIVTFLYTDLMDSAESTRAVGDIADDTELKGPYYDRLREIIYAHHGRFQQGVLLADKGAGIIAVFELAYDAVRAAIDLQHSLQVNPIARADGAPLARVRIGIHTATAEVGGSYSPDYRGNDLNLAARIQGIADAGQILISRSTAEKIGFFDQTWEGDTLTTWPGRFFQGQPLAHDVYEVCYPGWQSREPGSRQLPGFYTGERNRYIPRPEKEAEVLESLGFFATEEAQQAARRTGRGASRLVTVLAEGGMGKTRLAVACAIRTVGHFLGGIVLVDCATDPVVPVEAPLSLLAERMANALSLKLSPDADVPASVLAHLQRFDRGRSVLLLVDNYESLKSEEGDEFLGKLVTRTTGVTVLVTSRTDAGPASLSRVVTLESGMRVEEAIALFTATVQRSQPDWQVPLADQEHLNQILILTEHMPLALELIASWVTMGFTLEALANGLAKTPLKAFTQLPEDAVGSDIQRNFGRHLSMLRSLDWSWQRLSKPEQEVFAALSLFATDFDREAARAVCGPTSDPALNRLIRASLLRQNDQSGRLSLHHLTRAYTQLRFAGDADHNPPIAGLRPDRQRLAIQRFISHFAAIMDRVPRSLLLDTENSIGREILQHEWQNIVAAALHAAQAGFDGNLNRVFRISAYLSIYGHWAVGERMYVELCEISRRKNKPSLQSAALNNLGNLYRNQGKWSEAEQSYNESLATFRTLGDKQGEGRTLNNLGSLYQNQGKWSEAEQAYNDSLAIKRALGDKQGEGQTLGNLGGLYRDQGKWSEAEQAFNEDLTICRTLGDKQGEGQTLVNLGGLYQNQGKWSEAEQAYNDSLAIKRTLGDKQGEGQTLVNLGSLYQNQGKWSEAEQAYNDSLAIKRTLGDKQGEGQTLVNLGSLYQNQGKWSEAEQAYNDSLAIKRTLGDKQGEGQTLVNLGSLYQNQGKWSEAEQAYNESLATFRALGDKQGEGRTLVNLGLLYQNQGKWSEAEQSFNEILATFRALGDKQGESQTLSNLGSLYQNQGKWSEAERVYHQALLILRTLGDLQGEGQTLNNLGLLYQAQGQGEEAERHHAEALVIFRRLGHVLGEGRTLNNLGVLCQSQRRWQEAEEAYKADLKICRDLGDPQGTGQALGNLGNLYRSQGRWAEAEQAYQEALTLLRPLGDRIETGRLLTVYALLAARQGEMGVAVSRVREGIVLLEQTEATPTREWAHGVLQTLEARTVQGVQTGAT